MTEAARPNRCRHVALVNGAENDGWDTEVFSGQALAQLEAVGRFLSASESDEIANPADICTADFSCPPLRPNVLKEAFRDATFVVRRWQVTSRPAKYHGQEGFSQAVNELKNVLRGAINVRTDAKVVRVDMSSKPATRSYFQASGHRAGQSIQMNATWDTTWTLPAAGRPTRIRSIRVESHEEVVAVRRESPLFADCTAAILGENHIFEEQLRPGIDHWLERIELLFGIHFGGWQGLAVEDVNGDGLDNLNACQPGGLPNSLFVQNPDGTATGSSAASPGARPGRGCGGHVSTDIRRSVL